MESYLNYDKEQCKGNLHYRDVDNDSIRIAVQ